MKKPLWLVLLLLAGCRSEQVAFQFQPVAPMLAVAAPVANVPAAAPAAGATAPAAMPAGARPAYRLHRVLGLAPSAALFGPARVVPGPSPVAAPLGRLLPRHLLRQRAAGGAAESGLGHIAVFFIAVVLGVLAGLAALVNVIFGVGFFTALGYTAAGLLVLFLLYKLLSGGKKKK